jgi:hypothetical protein
MQTAAEDGLVARIHSRFGVLEGKSHLRTDR